MPAPGLPPCDAVKPLPRTILIGTVVSACVIVALAAAWWTARATPDAAPLASRLPAETVFAYAEFPRGEFFDAALFERIAPSLPPPPSPLPAHAVAAAAVRAGDVTGWITMSMDEQGKASFGGSDPTLSALLTDERARLDSDRTFRDLRMSGQRTWTYIAFPATDPKTSTLAGMFALDTPMSYAIHPGNALTLRFGMRPTPNVGFAALRPLTRVPDTSEVIVLPPRSALAGIATTLSDDAMLVAETLATTFVDSIARDTSIRYELAPLFDGPSVLQLGTDGSGNTVFAFDGKSPSGARAEAILRTLHERFGSMRERSRAKTVSAEGYSLTTLTPGTDGETTRSQDGGWTTLRTDAGGFALASAHDAGGRFTITNAPDLLRADDESTAWTPEASTLAWTDSLAAGLRPLWPSLATDGGAPLTIRLSDGPGYVQWDIAPLAEGL